MDAVIQLPPDLFFGTTIQTCILVLKKSRKNSDVLFINAEREFGRAGNKNKLRDGDIAKILSAYSKPTNVDYFSAVVSAETIKSNDFSLSIPTYVIAEDTREVIDIKKLNSEIIEIVKKESELRTSIDAIVADLEGNK